MKPRAFSLIEMLATVAALVIVLGLMVSLSRYVRRQASDQLTKQLLAQLDLLIRQYQARYKALPEVPAFVPTDEAAAGAAEQESGGPGEHEGSAASPRPPTLPAPLLSPLPDDDLPPEKTLQENALTNNRAFVQVMRIEALRHPAEFEAMPHTFSLEGTLPDAWGTPIVFMPALHPAVGMAMENRPFFLSAGPDRQFSTLADNLYSYEVDEEPER